ncbi:MAG: hypothetical protein IJ074_08905 [Clostridia bacterium]|nr:hypothetical protein [Clostridia bacterium]
MSKQKRLIALLMCVGILLTLFVSCAYIVDDADHDCTGEDCPICEFIAQIEHIQRGFTFVVLALLLTFLVSPALYALRARERVLLPVDVTLVSWKIRLND